MTPTNTEALAIAESLEKRLDCSSLVLTADVERAAAELRRLSALCSEWEAKAATWLASPEAAQRLEGYRELGRQCADLEAERDALRADAERYRWLREQHEGHEELAFDAEGLPMPLEPTALAFTVFHPKDGGLEPVGCIPGELDATIDAARAAMKGAQ